MLKEEKVVVIIYKLCKAVYYAYFYGIAHRGIKPENVLLTSESEEADIRLLDFGLSKIVFSNQKYTEQYIIVLIKINYYFYIFILYF